MSDNVVFSYGRWQALSDGVLIDVSDLAREAGFRVPVAVTEAVYNNYLDPTLELCREGQSFQGRAWDLLHVLRFAAAIHPNNDTILFEVLFILTPGCSPESVSLKAICGPGDEGEPVLTILLPLED